MNTFIIFCGIDGSGKTTQLNLLVNHLKERKLKVKAIWFRWPVLLSYPFLGVCRLLGYTKWVTIQKSSIRIAERKFYLNKALAKLWPWFFVMDTFLHSFIRIFLPLKQGCLILCDRYVPDIAVDLMCDTHDPDFLGRLSGRLLFSLIPRNSKLFLIDVSEETAYKRKNDIPSLEYLRIRRELYLKLARTMNIPILDGTKKPQETHQEITETLL
jgi:thymidylate kinase